jgi:hypothetical protein
MRLGTSRADRKDRLWCPQPLGSVEQARGELHPRLCTSHSHLAFEIAVQMLLRQDESV